MATEVVGPQEHSHRGRLLQTMDSLIDPFVLVEAVRDPDGRIVDFVYVEANLAACEYTQFPRDELVGSRLLDLLPGQAASGLVEQYRHVVETGEPLVLNDFAYDHELKGGQERYYDIRAVRFGDGLSYTWRDVTSRYESAAALAAAEGKYRMLAENATDAVFMVDNSGVMTWASPSTEQMLGIGADELVGTRTVDLIHPDDLPVMAAARARLSEGEPTASFELRVRTANGLYRWVSGASRNVQDSSGTVIGRITGMRDVHEQLLARLDLADSERRYRLLAENVSDVVWQTGADGRLVWASESVTAMLGWRWDQIAGQLAINLVHPEDRAHSLERRTRRVGRRATSIQCRVLCADGSSRSMEANVHPVSMGAEMGEVIALRDIQDEVDANEMLAHASAHDALTGLATRSIALGRIDSLLSRLRPERAVAVLCIGIDSLTSINDALTHAAGDVVIKTIGTRVAALIRDRDMIARGAGDEFLVLLSDLAGGADAGFVADRVRVAAKGTIAVGGHHFEPTVSVGISTGNRDSNAADMLRDAALAMRAAKNNGRDRCEFAQAQFAHEAQRRLVIEDGIRDGLRDGEFFAWFQPVVNLVGSNIVGYEALVRWVRPDGRVAAPAGFLPVAEGSSLIVDLDLTVLRQALALLVTLPPDTHVAVNVSAQSLATQRYVEHVSALLDAGSFSAAQLRLEVTETALLAVPQPVIEVMFELAERGVAWYVDDFGTGYSSIAHLRDLPIKGLKLDLSFTAGIRTGDLRSEQLSKALVGLADGLGLDTVAEGIETLADAAVLRAQGWKHGQGWLYGRPAPIRLGS